MTCVLCPHRPTGGESNNAGVLLGRGDIRRNSRSPVPLSNGRQRDGVHYSHHKTHKRHNLDQIPHGQAWIAELRHLRAHLVASNNPSILKKSLSYCSYVHQWTAGVLLMSVLVKKATGYLKVPCGFFFQTYKSYVYCQCHALNPFCKSTTEEFNFLISCVFLFLNIFFYHALFSSQLQ